MNPERPPISATGTIETIREKDRLFNVRMANGYVAIAVVAKESPETPEHVEGARVEVIFSPYDMSRCKIVSWEN